jgi:formate C-acetyltransferase
MGYKDMLSDEERAEMHEILKYWFNKSVQGAERQFLAEEDKPYWSYMNQGVFVWVHGAHSGQVPNYEKLFQVGLKGFKKEAEDKLADNPQGFLKKKAFLEAVIISIDAAVRWANRYADLARSLAELETDEKRKKELLQIAESCSWVPENPPRSFHEVLQAWFLMFLLIRVLDIQTSGIGDRIDYLWYPFYKKDKDEGKITPEDAQELIAMSPTSSPTSSWTPSSHWAWSSP